VKNQRQPDRAANQSTEPTQRDQQQKQPNDQRWLCHIHNHRLDTLRDQVRTQIRSTAITVLQLDRVFSAAGWTKHSL